VSRRETPDYWIAHVTALLEAIERRFFDQLKAAPLVPPKDIRRHRSVHAWTEALIEALS